jgi:hypothetical protein
MSPSVGVGDDDDKYDGYYNEQGEFAIKQELTGEF